MKILKRITIRYACRSVLFVVALWEWTNHFAWGMSQGFIHVWENRKSYSRCAWVLVRTCKAVCSYKEAHVFLYATAGQSRAFVFSIQAKDSWACCPDLLPKSWLPPLMPLLAFVLPRNTPGTVINSSRLLIIWSTAANWTSYDRYKIRQVDIRWPILPQCLADVCCVVPPAYKTEMRFELQMQQ